MPTKPPLLAAIDGDDGGEDRRERYARKMRERGYIRAAVWADPELVALVRAITSARFRADPLAWRTAATQLGVYAGLQHGAAISLQESADIVRELRDKDMDGLPY